VIIVSGYAANVVVNLITARFHVDGGIGVLLLGMGEAARGIVLLFALAFVLESRRELAVLTLLAMIPACFLVLAGWQIHLHLADTISRLLAGGAAYVGCTIIAVKLLFPETFVFMLARMRSLFSASETRQ
jgi:putative peptidoglycan lipid II flippase